MNKKSFPELNISKLPETWRLKKLGGICHKIGTGATPRGGQKVYLEKRIQHALIRSQNVFDRNFDPSGLVFITNHHASELSNAQVKSGDLLLNITGDGVTFGRSCIVPDEVLPACVNQHVSIIRLDTEQCEPGYLLSFLTHPQTKSYIESFNSGGSRRAITKGHIESFEIPLPPIREQREIAQILGSLDDKIEINRRMTATLEAMARALFQSWFVDFDPVRAKLDGRKPAGMDDDTAALFPSGFQDSELGLIPSGWQAGTVIENFILKMGQSPPGETYNEEGDGMPFYQGRTDFGFRFPTRRLFCNAPSRIANPNDTLVSVRAPVGDVNLALEECCIGRGVASVRHKSGGRSFTLYSMKTLYPEFTRFEAEGTVFGSITKDNFEKLPFIAPNSNLVRVFEEKIRPIDDQIQNLEKQSIVLAEIRDSLLPKLLSGEIRL